MENGWIMPRPFTVAPRMEMSECLKRLQAKAGMRLVGDDEEARINRVWANDVIANFDRAKGRVSL